MKQFELEQLLSFVKYKNYNTQDLKINDLKKPFSNLISILKKTEMKSKHDSSFYLPAWLSFEKEDVSFFKNHFSFIDDDAAIQEEIDYLDELMPNQTTWLPCHVSSYRDFNELTLSIGEAFIVINIKENIIYINHENHIDNNKIYDFNADIKVLNFLNWFIDVLETEYSKIMKNKEEYYKTKENIDWRFRYSKINIHDYAEYALKNDEEIYLFSELTKNEISYFIDNKDNFIESDNKPINLNKNKVLEIIRLALDSIDIKPQGLSDSDFYIKNRLVRDPFHHPEEKSHFVTIGDTEEDFEQWFNHENHKLNKNFLIEIGDYRKSFLLEAYKTGDKFKLKIYAGDTFYSAEKTIKIVRKLNELGLPVSLSEAQEYFNYLNGDTFIGVEPNYSISYRKDKLDIENLNNDEFSFYKSSEEILRHKIPDKYIIKYNIDSYFI